MKQWFRLLLVVFVAFFGARPLFSQVGPGTAESVDENAIAKKPVAAGQELVIADFDSGDKPSNIGGDFGTWDKDPNDETQGCQMTFEAEDALGNASGYSIRLDYDVDSPNPAYNGFWMKLKNLDATAYNTLNFYVKGSKGKEFTKRLKIELKDSTMKPSQYIISGITDEWQKFSIPFEKFARIKSWDTLSEFVVVFDDINSNPKSGTIFVDHVSLSAE